MAERKSDYTADRFGDWEVQGRVEGREDWMIKGKRYWNVTNLVTDEHRVVEQTKLKDLPKEDVVAPVKLVANGSNLGWAEALPTMPFLTSDAPGFQGYQLPEDDGLDFHVGEAPELPPLKLVSTEYDGDLNADGKIPGNNKGEQVLEPDWADKAAALHNGPKLISPITGVKDVLANLGIVGPIVDEAIASIAIDAGEIGTYSLSTIDPGEFESNVVTKFGGVGEAAEEQVSEAELDGRVPAPDPIRTAVRALMGQIHTAREQALALEEQVGQLQLQLTVLMDLNDDLLREVITR